MDTGNADRLLDGIDYKKVKPYEDYFESIRPTTLEDKIRRGLFALSSIHVTWQANVALYAKLWDLKWVGDEDLLRERIIESRAGLVNSRQKACMKFVSLAYKFPDALERKPGEVWYQYRDRLSEMIFLLGPAKSAFFIELMHFEKSRIVCFDTHLLQAYAIPASDVGKVSATERARMEVHWDLSCRNRGLNPVTARWILFDQRQGKEDSRYWSHVLEGTPVVNDPQLELFTGESSDIVDQIEKGEIK